MLSALLIFHSLRTKGRRIAAPTPLGTHRGVSNPTAPPINRTLFIQLRLRNRR